MLVATTEGLAGRRGVGANSMAGVHALGNGGAPGELGEALAAGRREALAQLAARAEELGADAVAGVRFDTAEVGHDMVEIVAYGTAVAVAPD